jgi:hypothetical protein
MLRTPGSLEAYCDEDDSLFWLIGRFNQSENCLKRNMGHNRTLSLAEKIYSPDDTYLNYLYSREPFCDAKKFRSLVVPLYAGFTVAPNHVWVACRKIIRHLILLSHFYSFSLEFPDQLINSKLIKEPVRVVHFFRPIFSLYNKRQTTISHSRTSPAAFMVSTLATVKYHRWNQSGLFTEESIRLT